MGNRIPRKFNRITGEVLVDTNLDIAGDTLHVFKNDFGYLALNKRTGKYGYMFASMLRNSDVFSVTEIA